MMLLIKGSHILLVLTTLLSYQSILLTKAQDTNKQHATRLDIDQLLKLSDNKHFEQMLTGILRPRVPGTPSHEEVKNFIIRVLESMKLNVTLQQTVQEVPKLGQLTFTNIIAKLNPNAERYLTLACHYDSKYFKDVYFEGATDSAVPCAIMLNSVKTLLPYLNAKDTSWSLMLIFFDGEEAFVEWGPDDSIYGAKALAAEWQQRQFVRTIDKTTVREIDRIGVLVLLDLIGSNDMQFASMNPETVHLFAHLSHIEDTLQNEKKISIRRRMFKRTLYPSYIEDDHIPFVQNGIPVLHLISVPFPKVWHTTNDDRKHLSPETINNFSHIFRIFLYQNLVV